MTSQQDFDTADVISEIEEVLVSSAGLSPSIFRTDEEASLEELGLESLAVMELQAVMKDRYGVHIPDDSLEMSVAQIVAHVGNQLEERK